VTNTLNPDSTDGYLLINWADFNIVDMKHCVSGLDLHSPNFHSKLCAFFPSFSFPLFIYNLLQSVIIVSFFCLYHSIHCYIVTFSTADHNIHYYIFLFLHYFIILACVIRVRFVCCVFVRVYYLVSILHDPKHR